MGRDELLDDQQRAILDALTEGVFTVDASFRITAINSAAEEICGIPRDEALGMPCRQLFRASCCDGACALAETMRNQQPIHCRRATILDANGRQVPVSISTNLLRDSAGTIIGGVETFRDLSQIEHLRRELSGVWRYEDLVFRSQAMRQVCESLPAVADSQATVLIRGESGTGKELVARALHHGSPRKTGPFVAVNCAALPDSLLESELFGYRKGAFTGASTDRAGRFESAAGGTLFLDEIGDISPAMQVRLLRVLQERRYEPLGSSESLQADVRVLAATNRDLEAAVAADAFRSDLYYRLNVIEVQLPPLRERPEDVHLLVEHFLQLQRARNGGGPDCFSVAAMQCLLSYTYPGNVRELENAVERACVLCRAGEIQVDHLPNLIRCDAAEQPVHSPLVAAEAEALRQALAANGWNRAATARALGVHKTTLYRKIRRLGLQPPTARPW
ncbi:MAG: sigma 54-interacting transcriptional regulator [Planctomycetota bacterium]|jgi:PAS domain S-box-containing protein|nr:sigma 54-interacting transcriptional regulator [Planctomycetota bacterium]